MSAYGHQQKFKNFEKVGANLGQSGIPEVPIVNGLVLNGNVLVINGRSTRTCIFKLTPATLALKVCKTEGGKRSVYCMDKNEFSWPKVLSGGPELIIQSDGLAKAQLVESLKGTLDKPGSVKKPHDGHGTWVQGESSSISAMLVVGPSVLAATPVWAKVVSGLPTVSATSSVRATVIPGSPAVSAASPVREMVVSGSSVTTAASTSVTGGVHFWVFQCGGVQLEVKGRDPDSGEVNGTWVCRFF